MKKSNPYSLKLTKVIFILLSTTVWSQQIISEEINLQNDEILLPGTLSYPKTKAKIPLIIFVHGSGNVDRNGNQSGTPVQANYIKALADSITTKGIAFYSYDKRTSTIANLHLLKNIAVSDFAADAKIAIQYFKKDKRFNTIHLVGHSQGSLVAMLSITKDVNSFTSLAGPSESIDKVVIAQFNQQNKDFGTVAAKHFKELAETDTIQTINPLLYSLFSPQNQKFLANWMLFNPTTEIRKITIPVLVIQGDKDLQVNMSDAENLHKANSTSEIQIIKNMNHVLKQVNSMEENQKSYQDKSFPLSKELVQTLLRFVLKNS